jgi:hypothetical protein
MSENFITLFNYNFLPQGLCLHSSLMKYFKEANLTVLCMDKKVENFLINKKLKNLKVVSLEDFENEYHELISVKSKRKFIEYCWTLTPFCPDFFFKKIDNKAKQVTYVDADIFFYRNIKPIFDEFKKSKKSVFLTEHGFHNNFQHSKKSGRFCVQFLIFKNDLSSIKIINWWKKKCLEWCHDFFDKGRLGDQMYLDRWPKLFPKNIYISKNLHYFQAPWTRDRFNSNQAILYHFHGLRVVHDKFLLNDNYNLPNNIIKKIYIPYCQSLKKKIFFINDTFNQIIYGSSFLFRILYFLKLIYRYLVFKKIRYYKEIILK